MSIITLPAQFTPRSCALRLSVSQRVSASPFGGSEEAVDLLNDRWLLSCEVRGGNQSEGAWLEAFIGALRGQSNTVPLHHFARPAPLGTIRGNLTLSAAAAQGANQLTVTAAIDGPELIVNGDFSVNTANWATSTVYASTAAAVSGAMQVTATAAFGRQLQAITTTVGAVYCITGKVRVVSGGGTAGINVVTSIGADVSINNTVSNSMVTLTQYYTAVAAITYIACACTSAGSVTEFDDISVKRVTQAGATLKAGDVLGVGGLLVMVQSDCTASTSGGITIPITNRLRVAQPSGAAVTWDKPTFNARLLDTSGVQYRSAVTEPVSFDFGEAI